MQKSKLDHYHRVVYIAFIALVLGVLAGASIKWVAYDRGFTTWPARYLYKPTIEDVIEKRVPPTVPACHDKERPGGAYVKAGDRRTTICVNAEGRIAEWLTERDDARLSDSSIEFAPQKRFPHSFALDGGTCRVSYSYGSIDRNDIMVGEWEEFQPSIRDRDDGLIVCHSDQAPGRYVAPSRARR